MPLRQCGQGVQLLLTTSRVFLDQPSRDKKVREDRRLMGIEVADDVADLCRSLLPPVAYRARYPMRQAEHDGGHGGRLVAHRAARLRLPVLHGQCEGTAFREVGELLRHVVLPVKDLLPRHRPT